MLVLSQLLSGLALPQDSMTSRPGGDNRAGIAARYGKAL